MDNMQPDDYPRVNGEPEEHASMDNRRRPRREPMTEVLERVRRIETRVTQTAIAMGVRTDAQRPVFDPGSETGARPARLTLPSPHSSMREVVDSIPQNWQGPVKVFVGDQQVAVVERSGG